jgi:hypothetical protein
MIFEAVQRRDGLLPPPSPPRVQAPITDYMAKRPATMQASNQDRTVREEKPARLIQQTLTGKPAPAQPSRGASYVMYNTFNMLSTFGCPDVVEAPKGPTIDAVTDAWRNSSTQRKIHSGGEAQERHKAVKKPRHRFSGDARHVGLDIVPSHVWRGFIVHAEESTDDIEDDDVDVSKAIRSIFKYDRRRYEESS